MGEAAYEGGSPRIVVETGFWIFGKKRMIPAGTITKVDNDAREVHLAMTKDEVRDAPDWRPDRWPDDDYRSTHGTYYEEFRGPGDRRVSPCTARPVTSSASR